MKRFHRSGTNRQATYLSLSSPKGPALRSSIPSWHSDDSSVVPSSVTKQPSSQRFKHGCVKRRSSFFHRFLSARKLHCSFITPFCNRPSGNYILTGSANFPPGFPVPFCLVAVLPFSNIHNCHPGYVKFAPKKPQTGRVKLKFHQVPGRLNFHCVKGKTPLGLL